MLGNDLFCEFSGPLVTVIMAVITVLTLCRGCASLPVSHVAHMPGACRPPNTPKVSRQGTL
jgi:hypothetical protein